MTSLAQSLRAEIAQRGPLPFREFMARALYDPAHGYYGAGKARVGRGGDFFTNVSVGPLFGRLLARQFVEMWQRLGEPGDFVLVEQGAHHGDLAADVLAALREFDPACFDATTLWIVEPLSALQHAQAETLRTKERRFVTGSPICHLPLFPSATSALGACQSSLPVRWANMLDDLPPFCGVHYSNELLDAFPVHRVAWRGDHWKERCVDFQGDRFVFVDGGLSSEALRTHLAQLPSVPENYETEVNLDVARWLAEVASKLRAGFVLAIDYGYARREYYRPERASGTLSAYAAHQRVPDPLERPGEIDLTAHVDFTSLAKAAAPLGLQLAGFTDQHHFMVGLSRLHFPDDNTLITATKQELRAFKTLMHPGLMGQSFHAICLAKDVSNLRLSGFAFGDGRQRL